MQLRDFDFSLPQDLIALRPVSPRDQARLLIVHEGAAHFEEARVCDLPRFLRAGDVMVANDTRVLPVQLQATRPARGQSDAAAIDLTLHTRVNAQEWLAFAKPGRKLVQGDQLSFSALLSADVAEKRDEGDVRLAFNLSGADLDAAVAGIGRMPLPPYIAARRAADAQDQSDYQTLFAAQDGAVAAPTAGLHFTPALLEALTGLGVGQERVTLHVGPGTFLPVRVDDIATHQMHAEWAALSEPAANRLNAARDRGGRVLAIGTTSLRTLESAIGANGRFAPYAGETRIFLRPGVAIRSTGMLLTNFHLPQSTLFMLVCAFCGLETMQRAYAHAIARRFRFFSYGDACLLIRKAA
ncbi:MAG TPA: tRNA preQ1(34) S-adenosylmethionine ribosyltransferase-isomerase QueA [Alphaproteobacteria bacterium]|nr:tRNA preQ1(34) S-adenosylmethionine ribosyltransferase-isomerase QueA [Alphaproteobacteria bacterium]